MREASPGWPATHPDARGAAVLQSGPGQEYKPSKGKRLARDNRLSRPGDSDRGLLNALWSTRFFLFRMRHRG